MKKTILSENPQPTSNRRNSPTKPALFSLSSLFLFVLFIGVGSGEIAGACFGTSEQHG